MGTKSKIERQPTQGYTTRADATPAGSGNTRITVAALAAAIPSTSTAAFPSEVYDRSAVDLDRKFATKDVTTLNTDGEKQVKSTTKSSSLKAPGHWYWKNAGARICEAAAEARQSIWVTLEYEPPSEAYSKGEIISGKAIIVDLPKPSPADGFVGNDISFEFSGATTTTPPVPV